MRVLIVEDDRHLADVTREGLEEIGMAADIVSDGEAAVRAATSQRYDVVVLDVMLGNGPDGFEVCTRLRQRDVPSAVLMLTALDAIPDRVRGLDAGADDYLSKPFAFTELAARLRALGRRPPAGGAPQTMYESRDVHLDMLTRRVTVNGEEVSLTRKEFDILELLLSNPDHVLSKDRIRDHVWPAEVVHESNLVEVYVARLRRKLAEAGGGEYISTVRNVGYRFERRATHADGSPT
jgi:DNA-binding response OmpR family regulator